MNSASEYSERELEAIRAAREILAEGERLLAVAAGLYLRSRYQMMPTPK